MKFNCIAVDDDPSSLEVISDYISSLDNFKLIHAFIDPEQALHFIRNSADIDVIFMDIEMPKMSGVELAKLTKHKCKKLIFTTAHPKYAIDAFEIEADGFLLKPFSFSKFSTMLNKLLESKLIYASDESEFDDYFFIKSKDEKFKLIKVLYKDIIAIESMQNYVSIFTTNKTIVANLTLTKAKEILKNQTHIIQVHRSFMISKKHIDEIENNILKMRNNIWVTLGENYKEDLLSFVKGKTIKTGKGLF